MHVLQLTPFPPPEGGVSRNALAIRDELRRTNNQCSIIATSKSDVIIDEPEVYHPRTAFELIKLLIKLKYDILHIHVGGEIPRRVQALLATCAFFGRGKCVLTLHSGGYAVDNAATAKKSSLNGFVFRRFTNIIVVNQMMRQMFENFGVKREKIKDIAPFVHQSPDKSIVIPEKFGEFADKHQPFLLSAAGLEDTYDLFMQIDAMGEVLAKLPDAGLMIIGAGSLESDLKAAIAEKTYADRIFLTGSVEHPITLHLINRADVLLRTTKFDGDAISVREALFLETPVIATDNKMRPEGVHLIPISDADALVKMIESVTKIEKKPKVEKAEDRRNIAEVLEVYREITGAKK